MRSIWHLAASVDARYSKRHRLALGAYEAYESYVGAHGEPAVGDAEKERAAREAPALVQAEKDYEAALQLCLEVEDFSSACVTHRQLGLLAQLQGRTAEAVEAFVQAFDLFANLPIVSEELESAARDCCARIVRLLASSSDRDAAMEVLQRVGDLAISIRDLDSSELCRRALGDASPGEIAEPDDEGSEGPTTEGGDDERTR